MRFTAVAFAFVVTISVVHATEELTRRRDLVDDGAAGFAAVAWRPDPESDAASFVRSNEWGRDFVHPNEGKSTKSPKGPKGDPSKGTKGPNGTKGPKSSKSPKSPKSPKSKPPIFEAPVDSPYASPVAAPYPMPVDPPTKCPDIEFNCPIDGPDTCPKDAACKPACVPQYCLLPKDPHKIREYEGEHYVKLGAKCGQFEYVQGEPMGRHYVAVCCEKENPDTSLVFPFDAECATCGECKPAQKVNDACCKLAGVGSYGRDDIDTAQDARDGDYYPACKPHEVCCKCGPDDISYKCIDAEHEPCGLFPDCPRYGFDDDGYDDDA